MADRAGRPDNRRNGQHNQRQNFQRRQEVADGIEQLARIQRDQNHQRKIDKAIDKQRQLTATGQRRNTNFKRDGRGTRRSEQRPNRQIADGGKQHARHFADWRTQAINAAAHFGERDYGQHRKTHSSNQEADRRGPDVRTGLQTNHRRKNDITCANKQRKGHKAQSDDVTRF